MIDQLCEVKRKMDKGEIIAMSFCMATGPQA